MQGLWPFFVEVNVIQRKARRERTIFVTIDENGTARWTDHTGRMGRLGSGITFAEGIITHHRGSRELTPEQVRAERDEFTVNTQLTDVEFIPIRALVEQVGKPWTAGWAAAESEALHNVLEGIYWKHINRLMHEPFDPTDA